MHTNLSHCVSMSYTILRFITECTIQYTPTVRGRHELTVTVNGREETISPFPVFVSIHPTQLGKPVRVIPGLEYPTGIAITSSGEIVVSGWHGDVGTLSREGERLRSIKRSDHGLLRLRLRGVSC